MTDMISVNFSGVLSYGKVVNDYWVYRLNSNTDNIPVMSKERLEENVRVTLYGKLVKVKINKPRPFSYLAIEVLDES